MNKIPLKRKKQILQAYQLHLTDVVGLAAKTCQNHCRDVGHFLEAVPIREARELAKVGPLDLTSYFTARSADYQPASLRQVAASLRNFLDFAHRQGWTSQPLSPAIPKIAQRAHNDLPSYLSQEQLELLLGNWDRATAEGKRDFAAALCLARLGMRAGEVAALLLEHLDWGQGVLRINSSKNGSSAQLPLLA